MDGSDPTAGQGSGSPPSSSDSSPAAAQSLPLKAPLVGQLSLTSFENNENQVWEQSSVPSWGHRQALKQNQGSAPSKRRRPASAPVSRREGSASKHTAGRQLVPSSGPTPRHPGLSYQVQPAQIIAPSSGSCNDQARARNLGCRLGRLFDAINAPAILSVSRSASAPNMSRIAASSQKSQADPRTPRTQRGSVRRVSKVIVHQHDHPLVSPEAIAKKLRRPSSALNLKVRVPGPDEPSSKPSPKRSKSAKSVSFVDQKSSASGAKDEEIASPARKKSVKLLSSLSALRRVTEEQTAIWRARQAAAGDNACDEQSVAEDQQATAAKPATSARKTVKSLKEQEDGLMHGTLADLYDDEESLLRLCKSIESLQDPVSARGGARHATSAIFNRILAVVKRKAHLLHALESRKAAIEATHAVREELLQRILVGEAGPPLELVGLHKFVAAHTHRGGNPADANMCDFESFAATFGLPSKHRVITSLRSLCDEVLLWWIDATLREAEQGASFEAVRRVMAVAISAGASRTQGTLIKSIKTVENRLANKVLADAQDIFERDERAAREVESTGMPPVGQAEAAALTIREAIKGVVAQRVPANHPSLVQAQKLIQELEQKESERGFIVSRMKRRSAARQQT